MTAKTNLTLEDFKNGIYLFIYEPKPVINDIFIPIPKINRNLQGLYFGELEIRSYEYAMESLNSLLYQKFKALYFMNKKND